jgi:hypothetical protein
LVFEDTTIELAHDEAVSVAWVLGRLRDWLVPSGEAYRLLDEFLGIKPGVLQRLYATAALECVTVYSTRIAERVAVAEARSARG